MVMGVSLIMMSPAVQLFRLPVSLARVHSCTVVQYLSIHWIHASWLVGQSHVSSQNVGQ